MLFKKFIIQIFIFSFSVLLLGGCTKLAHLDELLALKALSDEQTVLDKQVQDYDEHFRRLVADVQNDGIKKNVKQKVIQRKYGEPILIKSGERNGENVEIWMYRQSVKFFGSDKVYLYFNTDGRLIDYEYILHQENADEPAEG